MSVYSDANGTHMDGDVLNASGTQILDSAAGAACADVSTADGSDAATTQALANALKTKLNALLAILRAGKFPS